MRRVLAFLAIVIVASPMRTIAQTDPLNPLPGDRHGVRVQLGPHGAGLFRPTAAR